MSQFHGVEFTRKISLKKVPKKYQASGVLVFSTAYPYSPAQVVAWFPTDAGAREYIKIKGKRGAFFVGALSYAELTEPA